MTGSGNVILTAIAHDSFLRDLGLGTMGQDQIRAVCERLVAEMADVVKHNVDQYDLVADQIERGGFRDIRAKLAPAMRRDLADYDPNGAAVADRGRERLYWLAVALADRKHTDGDVDLREVLARTVTNAQALYRPFYRRLLALSGREPLDGTDDESVARLQTIITILLEGVIVSRRAGYPVDEDVVVTAAMTLFFAFTKRPGEPPFDPESALTAELHASVGVPPAYLVSTDSPAASYGLAIDALRSVQSASPGIVRHASFHGLSGVPRSVTSQPAHVTGLRETVMELLELGWKLQRLVTIYTEADLEREIEGARELGAHGHARVHATVGGVGGHAATLSVDGRFVIVGLDDPDTGYVEKAVRLDDPAAIAFWKDHFLQVFDDRRHTFVVQDPSGVREDHIAELRARVRGLERILQTRYAPVELTPRQSDIVACLGRVPRPTRKEIARELVLSTETVKQHLKNLYEKFDIPEGNDRLGPLVEELRRRGMV